MSDRSDSPVIVTDAATLRRIVAEEVERVLGEERSRLRLLTAEEAGVILGVHARTVIKWAHTEGLPHRELGPRLLRFVESEIVEWGARREAG